MRVYLLGFNPHSAIQHFTISQLFYEHINITPLDNSKPIPLEILNSADSIILFIQDSLSKARHISQIQSLVKSQPKDTRAKIVWVPFDRYTSYIFQLLQIYHGTNFPRVSKTPPTNYPNYYYYNRKHQSYILEPHFILFSPQEIRIIMKNFKYLLPADLVICQSPLMAKDFIESGIAAEHINYPSTTMGAYNYHPSNRNRWEELLFITYDGSVPTHELDESAFQNIFKEVDQASGYLRIQQWTNSKNVHTRCNALLSYRKGSVIRDGSSDLHTIEQRWASGSKLNVAARACIPLLGYWQDSYECYSLNYPVLEIGTDSYSQYLRSADFRAEILNQCKVNSSSILNESTPSKWAQSMISFLRKTMTTRSISH